MGCPSPQPSGLLTTNPQAKRAKKQSFWGLRHRPHDLPLRGGGGRVVRRPTHQGFLSEIPSPTLRVGPPLASASALCSVLRCQL